MSHGSADGRLGTPMTIREGTDWYEVALIVNGGLHLPQTDLAVCTATYTVWPNQDTTREPVIALGTTAGMPVSYNTGEATKLTTAGVVLGMTGHDEAATTLASGASKGDSVITLDDASGAAIGRHLVTWLDTGEVDINSITGVDGADVTLSHPLSGDAASANVVKHYDGDWMLYNVLLFIPASTSRTLTPWGKGLYQLDFIDDFGHVLDLRISNTICLERGGGHG